MAIYVLEQYWRPIRSEDDLPPLDEDGYSKKLLVSLANATDPEIGEYRRKEDASGGAFYIGDFDETFESKRKTPQNLENTGFSLVCGICL